LGISEDYENALIYFDKVLDIVPNATEALHGKGITLSHLGDYENAIDYFERVLEIEPDNVSVINTIEILSKRLE